MNTDTGEILEITDRERTLLQEAFRQQIARTPFATAGGQSVADKVKRLENLGSAKMNYDPVELAAEMLARNENGPLVELRCQPDKACQECKGSGHAGGSIGNDQKFHPCRCCAMPLHWCNVHQREATHMETDRGPRRGLIICDPALAGVMMECECVDLTGIAELIE